MRGRNEGRSEGRIDAWGKVTGAKVYGSDMRPADRGWSSTKLLHALYVRAGAVGKVTLVEPARLPPELTPVHVVLARQLAEAKLDTIRFGPPRWMLGPGDVAQHPGQPVALLYYDEVGRWRDAAAWLRLDGAIHEIAAAEQLPEFDIRRLGAPSRSLPRRVSALLTMVRAHLWATPGSTSSITATAPGSASWPPITPRSPTTRGHPATSTTTPWAPALASWHDRGDWIVTNVRRS